MSSDPYEHDHNGEFHEPSLGQMASMATKGMAIAKISGLRSDLTWWQVVKPILFYWAISGGLLAILIIFIGIGGAMTTDPGLSREERYNIKRTWTLEEQERADRYIKEKGCDVYNPKYNCRDWNKYLRAPG